MKKRILLIILMVSTFFVNACSCDKFDIDTYASAVKNFNNSTGFSYSLTITTETEGENKYYLEESTQRYRVTPTRIVENFSSEMKKYEISKDSFSGNAAPVKIYELNRYYKMEEGKFYVNDRYGNINNKRFQNTTYENMYNDESPYNIKNLVPTFSTDYISNFNIEKDSDRNGYSVATFVASCPSFVECSNDVISYKVVINKEFYFDSIEFSFENSEEQTDVENEIKITKVSYKYVFNKYNGDVEVIFPSDLVSYQN